MAVGVVLGICGVSHVGFPLKILQELGLGVFMKQETDVALEKEVQLLLGDIILFRQQGFQISLQQK